MEFKIYNCYRCPKCEFFEKDALNGTERWQKRGWCKHFRQDVLRNPDKELKHSDEDCGI